MENTIMHCAITGADNKVSYADISRLSATYPFAEWAMLLSPDELSRSDDRELPRFPTQNWMARFIEVCPEVRKTVHLCGGMLQKFIDEDKALDTILAHVQGIQLNFKFREGGQFLLDDRHARIALVERVRAAAGLEVILQYGGKYEVLAHDFKGLTNVSLLIDGSAGSGQLPGVWPPNHPYFPTGFAGGLSPAVVKDEIEKIFNVIPPGYVVSRIDAETGYRDREVDGQGRILRDDFSIPKVEQMLRSVKPFAHPIAVTPQSGRMPGSSAPVREQLKF